MHIQPPGSGTTHCVKDYRNRMQSSVQGSEEPVHDGADVNNDKNVSMRFYTKFCQLMERK